jgi:hypothetical protein
VPCAPAVLAGSSSSSSFVECPAECSPPKGLAAGLMFQKGADWKPSSSTGTRTMYGSIAYVEDNYRNRKQMLSDETDSCVRTISVKKVKKSTLQICFSVRQVKIAAVLQLPPLLQPTSNLMHQKACGMH